MASGAGYNLLTTNVSQVCGRFNFMAISNLSTSKSIILKFNSSDGGNKYYVILPGQAFAVPMTVDGWEQMTIILEDLASFFTDAVLTDLI